MYKCDYISSTLYVDEWELEVVNKLCSYLEEFERLYKSSHFILEGKYYCCSAFLGCVLLSVFFDFCEGRFVYLKTSTIADC